MNVLVLNNDYSIVNIESYKKSIKRIIANPAVEILEYSENTYKYKTENLFIPSVIKLPYNINTKKKIIITKPFNKRNVWIQYNKTCVYCNTKLKINQVHLDHVKAKATGGVRDWDNIVCACRKCNTKKAAKTLEEANMVLLQPICSNKTIKISLEQRIVNSITAFLRHNKMQSEWKKYIGYLKIEVPC